MSAGSPVSGDVPGLFDCLINGHGLIFLHTVDTSLPFRTQRAKYSFTPTFLERTNVGAGYSDNQQDFFLTASQNNWEGGNQQRYLHLTDAATLDRFWRATQVDIDTPGRVASRYGVTGGLPAAVVLAVTQHPTSALGVFVTSTTAYSMNASGTIAAIGAHGLGAAPERDAICTDDKYFYISTTTGGTVGVRQWSAAGGFATFSATAANALAFVNNTLYGYVKSTGIFQSYSAAGVAATVYTFKDAAGGAITNATGILRPFGNKLLILLTSNRGSWLYQYDGTNVSMLAQFPPGFVADDLTNLFGSIAFISGIGETGKPTVYLYTGGEIELLWQSKWTSAVQPGIGAFGTKVYWNDTGAVNSSDQNNEIVQYNPATGAISEVIAFTGGTAYNARFTAVSTTPSFMFGCVFTGHTNDQSVFVWPDTTSYATTAKIYTSLIDFDNSLTKQFVGVKVDFDDGVAGGNTGSVTIRYVVDSLEGTYTTVTAAAVSGTEYALTGVSGRALGIAVHIFKGLSTTPPVLKRIYVRAMPALQSYRMDEFILDLSGRNGKSPVMLNNGQPHPLDGFAQATNLLADIQATSPFTIVTRHGSYTGVIEPGQSELIEIRPEEYIARIVTRGV